MRDGGFCAICYFRDGVETPFEEVHHVYSRGKKEGDWREHYTSLLCVCKKCHPLPIITPGGSARLGWVEEVLRKANAKPINKDFIHYGYGEQD